MYLNLFPEIKSWMRKTREQADRQTFLDNHYQYRHYFYAVTKWNSKYQRFVLGTDAKRCIAFGPQSDASAIQTEDLLTLAADPVIRPMLRLIIHDSHVLECPIDMVDYTCGKLYTTMSRPRPELGGLEIGVEIKVGKNLQDTEVWKP
jgi:DNA polymerase I-like protein with 3'-5' exonuclease and polymerase domains